MAFHIVFPRIFIVAFALWKRHWNGRSLQDQELLYMELVAQVGCECFLSSISIDSSSGKSDVEDKKGNYYKLQIDYSFRVFLSFQLRIVKKSLQQRHSRHGYL